MTLDRASIERAIGARRLADWVITERTSERLTIGRGAAPSGELWRSERADHLRVLVRRDLPSGRGTGVVSSQEHVGDAASLVARAVAIAEAAVEPAWDTPPPAAPARVELFDAKWATSLELGAAALAKALAEAAVAAGLAVERWCGELQRDDLSLSSALGFAVSWRTSRYQLVAHLRPTGNAGAPLVTVRCAGRRLSDLSLPAELAAAAQTAAAAAKRPASPAALPDEPVILELGAAAMRGDADASETTASSYAARGVWGAFIALADTVAARQGLRRNQTRGIDSSLTLWSDGALPFGLRSAPIGDEGEAVRRFRLWSAGAPGEPGLGPRAAARLGAAPNGGVRNLVINAGAADERSAAAPILRVHRLRLASLDAASGRATLELALAEDRERGAIYTTGTCALDLAHALAQAQRSPELVRRGDYHGPTWIRLPATRLR